MKNFVLIGAAGFVAPRHLRAIKETSNILYAAIDISDCVGILDSYFPQTLFFSSLSSFNSYLIQNPHIILDYMSICTPNFLHIKHIEFALQKNMNVICEKPIVLSVSEALKLMDLEQSSGKCVNTILQLRLHTDIMRLKAKVESILAHNPTHIFEIDLSYITARGQWYFVSWKGDETKSGGLVCNIGIHLFDMLCYIFGVCQKSVVHYKSSSVVCGYLELKNARVRWFLSIDMAFLPQEIRESGQNTYRCISVDGENIEFSNGFGDLHTKSYEEILYGRGFGISSALPSLEIVEQIQNAHPIGFSGDYHFLAQRLA